MKLKVSTSVHPATAAARGTNYYFVLDVVFSAQEWRTFNAGTMRISASGVLGSSLKLTAMSSSDVIPNSGSYVGHPYKDGSVIFQLHARYFGWEKIPTTISEWLPARAVTFNGRVCTLGSVKSSDFTWTDFSAMTQRGYHSGTKKVAAKTMAADVIREPRPAALDPSALATDGFDPDEFKRCLRYVNQNLAKYTDRLGYPVLDGRTIIVTAMLVTTIMEDWK